MTSPAVMGEPLSVISARGSPRFINAWHRPWTKVSVVSARYHCRWQPKREWSSRKPSGTGVFHSPAVVSTRRLAWWKSLCHSAWLRETS